MHVDATGPVWPFLATCSSTTMDDPAVSRLPVEIWHEILQMTIYDLEILIIDPYNVPPSQFFNCRRRPPDSTFYRKPPPLTRGNQTNLAYVRFMSFVFTIRSVCTTWNALGQEFSSRIISLRNEAMSGSLENQMAEIKRISLAYKIHGDALQLRCNCILRDRCATCRRKEALSPVPLSQIIAVRGCVYARIMAGMDEELLETVLLSPNAVPNLMSLTIDISTEALIVDMNKYPHLAPASRLMDYFDAISKSFSSLVYLGLSLCGDDMAPLYSNLNLPRLKSLELNIEGINLTACGWQLPALTSLDIRFLSHKNERFLGSLDPVGSHVLSLR